jgi:5-methylthioadenosine/S-adenosylhomocysteine deaminase
MGSKDHCDLLLAGGVVITVDNERRILDPGAIAIRDNEISAVGSADDLAEYEAKRIINCKGKMVTPGFIDCHNHLFESMLRGVGEGMKLWPWLSQLMQPFGDRVTRAEAVAAVTNCTLEAIRNGTTFIVDNHYAPTDLETTLAIAEAIDSTGMRERLPEVCTAIPLRYPINLVSTFSTAPFYTAWMRKSKSPERRWKPVLPAVA